MKVLKRVLKYTKPYRLYIIFALVSAIVGVSLSLFVPILIGNAVDFIIGENNVEYKGLLRVIVILSSVIMLSSFFQWIMTQFTNIVTYKTINDLRTQTFNKLNSVRLQYIDTNSHGDIISRIVNDIDLISEGLLQGFTQLFTGIVTIAGTLVFMFSINGFITAVVIALTPLSMIIASTIAKRSHKMFLEQSKVQGELSGYVEELIGNQRVVKAFGYEKRSCEGFDVLNERLYDCGMKSQFYSSLTNPCTRFVNGIVFAAVGIFGAIGAINGILSVGQITSFLTYANQYTKPFNEISGVTTQIQSAIASAKRVFAVLDEEEEESDLHKPELNECGGEILARNVSFSYDKDKELISNFNLQVKTGARIAIVGPTGSGKTTLINLLMRFYDVNSGEIKIDNINIKDVTRNSLRNKFGMVLQDTWLYNATVRENIAYGKPNATFEEIVTAAKFAYAHSFIKRLPEGYDAVITEDGGNISHGEKQLLCIARVMLADPPMLILDEATSSIDTLTEIRIQDAFSKMMEGRTSFVVAHRLSTIRNSDLILVMKDGKIAEQGTHNELITKRGYYHEMSGAV